MLKGIHLTLMMGAISASPVGRDLIESLVSAQVTVAAGSRTGFQMVFQVGKNSNIATQLIPSGFFDPPTRVILVVTPGGSSTVLIDGVITRQELSVSNEPGQSHLTITGEDVSRMMDLIEFKIPYPAMPSELRIALMIAKYAMYGIVPLIIPSILIDINDPTLQVAAQNVTDLAYINKLAAEAGYVFYIEPGPTPGMNLAYWGPEIKVGSPQPALTVNMDAASNVESLNFGYDPMGKTLFLLNVQLPVVKTAITVPVPDISPLNPPLGLKPSIPFKVEYLEGTVKQTIPKATMMAMSAQSKATDVITASGQLDVLRYGQVLKARQLVGVRGAGPAYDGLYYVKSVTHNLKRGEYKQSFSLTRNALVPFSNTLPV